MKKSYDFDKSKKSSENQNTRASINYDDYKKNFQQEEINESNSPYFNDLEMIRFYVYKEKNTLSKSTQKEYFSELIIFYGFLMKESKKTVDPTTTHSILQQLNLGLYFEKYQVFIGNSFKGKGAKLYSQNTVHRKTSVVKNFLEFLQKRNFIDFTLTRNFKYPKIENHLRPNNKLSLAEIKELFQFYKKHPILHALLSILVTTGIKLNELCTLQVRNIEYMDNEYWLIIDRSGEDKRRLLLLPSVFEAITTFRARRRLDLKLDNEDQTPLFTTAFGKAYSQAYLGNYLTTKLNDPNLSYVHHIGFTVTSATLRLTYATMCMSNNNDYVSLMENLGHNNIKNTKRFLNRGLDK